MVPYTTGRLFDPLIPDWTKDHAARYECVGVNGAPFLAKFEPSYNWSQHTMNMAQAYWQDKISDLAIYLHEHATFSGIYSDAVTGNAEACADPTAADGGVPSKYVAGAAWSNGIRAMWQKMRTKAGPGKMIMSESNTEAYVGVLDAQLAIYGFRSCGKVPAFQSVYADHTVMVGALGMDVLMGGQREVCSRRRVDARIAERSSTRCLSRAAGKYSACDSHGTLVCSTEAYTG